MADAHDEFGETEFDVASANIFLIETPMDGKEQHGKDKGGKNLRFEAIPSGNATSIEFKQGF